jgi:ubiquinone/menaquinone biosynthesis C-methylase UbiE
MTLADTPTWRTELNIIAREHGWRHAAQRHAETEGAPAYAYICDEARADFQFLLSLPENARGLDVGSEWGTVSIALARRVAEVVALDTDPNLLQFVMTRARQEGLSNVHPICADLTELPFVDEYFDLVILNDTLKKAALMGNGDSPARQTRLLQNAQRVLKPGGKLYIGAENRFSYKNLLGRRDPSAHLPFIALLPSFLADACARLARKRPYQTWSHSRRGLVKMLLAANFERVHFYYPVPDHWHPRYFLDYQDPQVTRFCLEKLRSHPTFTSLHYFVGRIGLVLHLSATVSPSLSVIAEK